VKIEYHLLEITAIPIFLGSGAFLLRDSLTHPGQPIEVIGGSVLLVLGGVVAGSLAKALFRQVQHDPSQD